MTSSIRRAALAGVLTLATAIISPAEACGPPAQGPAYVDAFGGETADLNRLYDGRVGLVMAQSPRALLLMDWRLLHGLPVGRAAGARLSVPCCDSTDPDTWQAANDWTQLRGTVTGVVALPEAIQPDRPIANDQTVSNCFEGAFANATATLTDRIKANGVASPWVKAWVDGQDAVFEACHGSAVAMPALDPAAPAWLKADRAYQEAARALYLGDNAAAASDFAAIGHDQTSPWRPMAPYLTARAYLRQALAIRTPANYAAAHRAINALAAAPPTTFGQSQARAMTKIIAYRENPTLVRAQLDAEMNAAWLPDDAAVDFRDYVDLNDKVAHPPQILDWIETIKGAAPGVPTATDTDTATDAQRTALTSAQNAYSLAHARAQWAATHDPAWLIAALSLVDPTDPAAPALAADAAKITPSSPAFLSAAYHRVRLTIAQAPEDQTGAALDAILARPDLSMSERNLFLGERMQVAEDLHSFAKLSLRTRLCNDELTAPTGCVRGDYNDEMQPRSVYDSAGKVGFAPDAQALIDRLPLDDRAALVSDSDLPSALRLDLALTSWTRAVLMQDNSQIDVLAVELKPLLPLLGPDWTRVASTKPGPDKRFAEFFIFAKMPGLATDLQTYTRPVGKLADFQGNWYDWMILPPGSTKGNSAPPCLQSYTPDGYCDDAKTTDTSDAVQWTTSDLVCLTYCGQGAFLLRRPDFAAAEVARAAAERRQVPQVYKAGPTTATSVWEEVLAYATAHPADPRSPEALYWLGHVARYGNSHNGLSKRAFDLLHQRYASSTWAKQTKYYYPDTSN